MQYESVPLSLLELGWDIWMGLTLTSSKNTREFRGMWVACEAAVVMVMWGIKITMAPLVKNFRLSVLGGREGGYRSSHRINIVPHLSLLMLSD